jgi:ubiquinone/menaquinone biosynthesis C-methylase UbiE
VCVSDPGAKDRFMEYRSSIGPLYQDYEGCDYEHFWKGAGKEYLDRLERLITSHTLAGGQSIVEVGAGFGRLGSCYSSKYAEVHMVEPASNLRMAATRLYGDVVKYHEASVYNLPFSDSVFDSVLMVRVFHHLGDPQAALQELWRILKPGGTLVFNYSNKRNLKHIIKFFVGLAANPFTRDIDRYHSSLFGHHPQFIETLLDSVGFRITEEYATGVFDKMVNIMPFLLNVMRPSLVVARLLGYSRIAPAQFVVAVKR